MFHQITIFRLVVLAMVILVPSCSKKAKKGGGGGYDCRAFFAENDADYDEFLAQDEYEDEDYEYEDEYEDEEDDDSSLRLAPKKKRATKKKTAAERKLEQEFIQQCGDPRDAVVGKSSGDEEDEDEGDDEDDEKSGVGEIDEDTNDIKIKPKSVYAQLVGDNMYISITESVLDEDFIEDLESDKEWECLKTPKSSDDDDLPKSLNLLVAFEEDVTEYEIDSDNTVTFGDACSSGDCTGTIEFKKAPVEGKDFEVTIELDIDGDAYEATIEAPFVELGEAADPDDEPDDCKSSEYAAQVPK